MIGIDVNKTSASHKYIICHYWYFLEISFRFQPKRCDGCHDLMQKAMRFNDVGGNDHRIHFLYMSKDEAINLLTNADLTEKSGT